MSTAVHVPPLMEDLVVVLAAALPVVFVCQKLGLPALVGFIVTGMLLGPSATGLIESTKDVAAMAEIGAVLLLFAIGLEFSIARVAGMATLVVRVGTAQVLGVLAIVAAGAMLAGYALSEAMVIGFVAALSSTAIVLKLLADRRELDTPHGRLTLGVLLFQDLSVIPMLLVLPSLGGSETFSWLRVVVALVVAAGGACATVVAARTVFPWLFRRVSALRSHELFVVAVAAACFGTAWISASLGISLAVGAFLAGLVVSESDYSHQIIADVVPLRDLFASLFFISIGMLLDFGYVAGHFGLVAALLAAFVSVKVALSAAAVLWLLPSSRIAVLVAAGLGQVGEFSFVIADEARRAGVLSAGDFQAVLAASVFSMLLAPIVLRAGAALAQRVDLPGAEPEAQPASKVPTRSHVVVIGYGFNGKNLARVLRETGIPYVVVEFDPDAVRAAAAAGHPVVYGDGARPVVLAHVHVAAAVVVVVVIDDPAAARRIVRLVREANPHAALVVRTRKLTEIDGLYLMGVDEVVPEEMETSVELFARVLHCLHVPANVIEAQVDVVRSEHYAMMRGGEPSAQRIDRIYDLFTAATTITHMLQAGSPAIGTTVGAFALRSRVGATLIAVVRKDAATTNPSDDYVLAQSDILVILGTHAQLAAARDLLVPRPADRA